MHFTFLSSENINIIVNELLSKINLLFRLKKYSSEPFPKGVIEILSQFKYVFNPSYVTHKQTSYLAIRVFDDITNSIFSMLYFWKNEKNIQSINLTVYFNNIGGFNKVSDPKLFIMNNCLWGSFNTGHTDKEKNKLCLFEMESSKIKNYYLCIYDKRNRVEKNWTFYSIDNQLFCLYSISPLIVLKAISFIDNHVVFEEYYKGDTVQFKNYSIGTQMIKINRCFYFIAHKKIFLNGKRLYFGKPFKFEFLDKPVLTSSKKFLIHSFRSLIGNKHKFNKNLISCTYFSGLSSQNDKIHLSYGINDIKWNIVTIEKNKLWD